MKKSKFTKTTFAIHCRQLGSMPLNTHDLEERHIMRFKSVEDAKSCRELLQELDQEGKYTHGGEYDLGFVKLLNPK